MTLLVWTLLALLVLVASDAICFKRKVSPRTKKPSSEREAPEDVGCRMYGRWYLSGEEFTGQGSNRCERLQCIDGEVILREKKCKASGNRCFSQGETFSTTTSLRYFWRNCICEGNGSYLCRDGQPVAPEFSIDNLVPIAPAPYPGTSA